MAHDALDALAGRLGVAPDRLSGLARCSGADLDRLVGLIDETFAAEDAAVEEGLQRTVRTVPLPLRRRARSLLFPEDGR
jgi:hypothetical protein